MSPSALFIFGLVAQCVARRLVMKEHRESPSLSLTVLNNSSLPVNFLAMPKMARIYATSKNNIMNGDSFEFTPALAAYDFYVTASDGANGWRNDAQAGWGMLKNGTAMTINFGLKLGVVGTVATGAAAVVTATVTAWAWAPTAIVAATAVTLLGVGTFSSMTVTAITDASMDFAARRFRQLRERQDPEDEMVKHSKGVEWFHFKDVVSEMTVQEAFTKAFPEVDMNRVVMSHGTATAYFAAMESTFSTWAVSKGKPRHFVLAGGFVDPTEMPEMNAVKVDFAQLALGEVKAEHGCHLADDSSHWRDRVNDCGAKCEEMMLAINEHGSLHYPWYWKMGGAKPKHKWPVEVQNKLSDCTKKCSLPFWAALRQEWQVASGNAELKHGQEKMVPSKRYGECWSKCRTTSLGSVVAAVKKAATLGGMGAWCHSDGDPVLPQEDQPNPDAPHARPAHPSPYDDLSPQMTGQVCSTGDECLDTREEGDQWNCVSLCG